MNKFTFNIGNKTIGVGRNVLIQTMGDKKTSKTAYLINLTNNLQKSGLDMMRFSVLDDQDIDSLKIIKQNTNIPLIADIHFDGNLALKAIEIAHVDKIRINPGNINESSLRKIIQSAKEHDIAIRIGVNSGSLNRYRGKTKSPVDDFFLAMDETLAIFEQEGFQKLVLSLKTSDPDLLEQLYMRAYQIYPYPLHLGLTEAGFGIQGAVKTTASIINLLKNGIGDTLRVSLADDRIEEIRACKTLLSVSHRRNDIPSLIVCPTCGRTTYDLKDLAREVESFLDTVFKPIKVAVMGCPVNGMGEAKDANYGIAGTGVKNKLLVFSKGKPIGTYPEEEAKAKLFTFIKNF